MDLIDRQAAIDLFPNDALEWDTNDGYVAPHLVRRMIKELPAIKPEIVRCKDCRYGVDYYHEGDCYCSNPKWGLKYFGGSWEFYCADAERRTE